MRPPLPPGRAGPRHRRPRPLRLLHHGKGQKRWPARPWSRRWRNKRLRFLPRRPFLPPCHRRRPHPLPLLHLLRRPSARPRQSRRRRKIPRPGSRRPIIRLSHFVDEGPHGENGSDKKCAHATRAIGKISHHRSPADPIGLQSRAQRFDASLRGEGAQQKTGPGLDSRSPDLATHLGIVSGHTDQPLVRRSRGDRTGSPDGFRSRRKARVDRLATGPACSRSACSHFRRRRACPGPDLLCVVALSRLRFTLLAAGAERG